MWKQRGGVKQRLKEKAVWDYHRDPERGGSGRGVRILEKWGWREGFGLGDGKGRLGKHWGQPGYWEKKVEIRETPMLHWEWRLTTAQGAECAYRQAGQPFSQVLT